MSKWCWGGVDVGGTICVFPRQKAFTTTFNTTKTRQQEDILSHFEITLGVFSSRV